jgi:hypothetical protein
MFFKYFNNLKAEYVNKTGEPILYRLWFDKWKGENPEFASVLTDTLYSDLGCKLINILRHSEMLTLE